jgi:diadenosine tetraphosphatase ApaH/serine/threonine PP2A family protein phosphatase
MNFVAREAAVWTRGQLSADARAFLAGLPYMVERDGALPLLFVHASANRPADWEYLAGPNAASRCLAATGAGLVCVGHVHQPMLYFSARGRMAAFAPQPGSAVPLSANRRWLALAGSVGQPRDGNPAASYLLYDDVLRLLTNRRVPYDWLRAAAKIRAAGLPESLAARLEHGA